MLWLIYLQNSYALEYKEKNILLFMVLLYMVMKGLNF